MQMAQYNGDNQDGDTGSHGPKCCDMSFGLRYVYSFLFFFLLTYIYIIGSSCSSMSHMMK